MRTNKRRNLNSGQWACIAAEADDLLAVIAEQVENERIEKQKANAANQHSEPALAQKIVPTQTKSERETATKAAELFNTNITAQFDNAALAMLCDPSELAVDPRTPLTALIEAEEGDTPDTLDLAGLRGIPVDALKTLVLFLLPTDSKPTSASYWPKALKRLCALSYAIGIEEVRKFPLSKIAPALGCSRAMLSLLCCELRDFASLDHRAGRSDAARETYSTRARQVWNHRAKMKREKSKTSL
jgi:hypothetical protein